MSIREEDGIFLGVISHTLDIPTEGEGQKRGFIRCPVCDRTIIGKGLHVYGYVVSTAVHEREVAAWRTGASGRESMFFEQDNEILSQANMPESIKVDFYCHDYLCLMLFFRNRYKVDPGILLHPDEDIDKFRAAEDSKPFTRLFAQPTEGKG